MKRNNEKYIFVNSKDIKRCSYEVRREFACNDYDNVYYHNGYETIDKLFEENNIPEKYRKIILQINCKIKKRKLFRCQAKELINRKEFKLQVQSNDKTMLFIKGARPSIEITKWVVFSTNSDLFEYDKVHEFFLELLQLGLLDNYLNTVLSFFRNEKFIKIKGNTLTKKPIQNY